MSFRNNLFKSNHQTTANDFYDSSSMDRENLKEDNYSNSITSNNETSWVSPNRTHIFSSLRKPKKYSYSTNINSKKKGSPNDDMSDISSIRNYRSSHYNFLSPVKNQESGNESESQFQTPNENENLFNRSVRSITEKKHRTSIIPSSRIEKEEKEDDVDTFFYYQNTGFLSPTKVYEDYNYIPLSERLTEAQEKKQKFIEQGLTENEKKFNEECTFTPTIVSKKLEVKNSDRAKRRWEALHQNSEEEEEPSYMNERSKEIAEKLTKGTDIFTRQMRKIYSQSEADEADNSYQPKKMSKKELEEAIIRLSAPKNDDFDDQNSEEEESSETKSKRFTKKESLRLLEESLTKNKEKRIQMRNELQNERYQKEPQTDNSSHMNEKSLEIVEGLDTEDRDLFEESVRVAENNFLYANEIQKYNEKRKLMELNEFKKLANKKYANEKPMYLYHLVRSTLMKAKNPPENGANTQEANNLQQMDEDDMEEEIMKIFKKAKEHGFDVENENEENENKENESNAENESNKENKLNTENEFNKENEFDKESDLSKNNKETKEEKESIIESKSNNGNKNSTEKVDKKSVENKGKEELFEEEEEDDSILDALNKIGEMDLDDFNWKETDETTETKSSPPDSPKPVIVNKAESRIRVKVETTTTKKITSSSPKKNSPSKSSKPQSKQNKPKSDNQQKSPSKTAKEQELNSSQKVKKSSQIPVKPNTSQKPKQNSDKKEQEGANDGKKETKTKSLSKNKSILEYSQKIDQNKIKSPSKLSNKSRENSPKKADLSQSAKSPIKSSQKVESKQNQSNSKVNTLPSKKPSQQAKSITNQNEQKQELNKEATPSKNESTPKKKSKQNKVSTPTKNELNTSKNEQKQETKSNKQESTPNKNESTPKKKSKQNNKSTPNENESKTQTKSSSNKSESTPTKKSTPNKNESSSTPTKKSTPNKNELSATPTKKESLTTPTKKLTQNKESTPTKKSTPNKNESLTTPTKKSTQNKESTPSKNEQKQESTPNAKANQQNKTKTETQTISTPNKNESNQSPKQQKTTPSSKTKENSSQKPETNSKSPSKKQTQTDSKNSHKKGNSPMKLKLSKKPESIVSNRKTESKK